MTRRADWTRSPWHTAKRAAIRQLVVVFLERAHGNVERAAELAGIGPRNFRDNMRRYGVRIRRDVTRRVELDS